MSLHINFRFDPDVGFTFVPNIQTRIPHESGGYLVRTNALGFRDDRNPAERAGDRRRVFVFGDSFTAGDGVSNGKRFSDELERLVPGVQFYNFGLSATGTDQQFIAYRKFASGLACDLVIVAILVENIRRITAQFQPVLVQDGSYQFRPRPYFELHDGKLVRFHNPVTDETITAEELSRTQPDASVDTFGRFPALRKLVRSLGLKELMQRLTASQPVPDYDSKTSPGWLLMRQILLDWRAATPCPLLVVPLPLYHHIEEKADASAYQQRFAEFAAETGIAVHDVLPDLRGYTMEQRRQFRFATDIHFTPAGHQAVARSMAPAVVTALNRAGIKDSVDLA